MPQEKRIKKIIDNLERTVRDAGCRQGWYPGAAGQTGQTGQTGQKVLVALSGGGDSMALLALLRRLLGDGVEAAHLEHGFRGETSLRDADFVRDYCDRVGVRCHIRHAPVDKLRRRGESSETAGRRIRYEFLLEVARERGLPFIATGHTADDVVETVLFNLFRGTGLAGLSGIPEVMRLDAAPEWLVVRPLIGCTRSDLRLYLAENGVPWCEDETNDQNAYSRNRIRNELLPWVRRNVNERADDALLGLSRECASLNGSIEREARSSLSRLAAESPVALAAWNLRAARDIPAEKLPYVIRAQGRALSLPVLDRARTLDLCALISRSGRWRFQWAGDIEVCAARPLIGWVRRGDLERWRASVQEK